MFIKQKHVIMKKELFQYPDLFEAVQMQQIFPDGKTFVDCVPKIDLLAVKKKFAEQNSKPDFDLQKFILDHFELPRQPDSGFTGLENRTVQEHIESLWPVLTREPDIPKGSLIPLPYSYIVPGGRFGEIYYWDSYFTMLGLASSGKTDMLENMVKNFSYLVDTLGYIPNGNRTYFIGRSSSRTPPRTRRTWPMTPASIPSRSTTTRTIVRLPMSGSRSSGHGRGSMGARCFN
jgi:alpha,alpha-trehalase